MKCFYHNDADGKCAGFWVHHRAYLEPDIAYYETIESERNIQFGNLEEENAEN